MEQESRYTEELPKLIMTNSLNCDNFERSEHWNIAKNKVEKKLYDIQFNNAILFNNERLSLKELYDFNLLLRRIYREAGVNLSEVILYFEELYVSVQRIRTLLDEENVQIIKNELSDKFSIKIPVSLSKFIKEKKKDGLPVK
jgi:hypothetical protein